MLHLNASDIALLIVVKTSSVENELRCFHVNRAHSAYSGDVNAASIYL